MATQLIYNTHNSNLPCTIKSYIPFANRNTFIVNHLLSSDDAPDTDDINIIKHSSYYSDEGFKQLQIAEGSLYHEF